MMKPDWMKWMLPLPRGMEVREGEIRIDGTTRIALPPGAGARIRQAAGQLRDDLKAWRRIDVPIVTTAKALDGRVIAIGHPSQSALVRETLAQAPTRELDGLNRGHIGNVTRAEPPAEGYLLRTAGKACAVAGGDDAGTFYGVQTLRQILRGTGGRAIPNVNVWDWPSFPVRAMHLMCPRRSNLHVAEQVVETLALWKLNTLILSFEYVPNFPFEGFGSLNDPQETLTRREHAAFAAKCRGLGLEVIPLVPSFGHLNGFIFKSNAWDEILERHADPARREEKFFSKRLNYCPSNPRSFEIFFNLFDQVLDAYPSPYLHIGHDEIDDGPVGVCPLCQGVPAWELLAEDLLKIHDRMTVKKGVRLMMWPDMIIPYFRGGPRHGMKNIHPHMFMHLGIDHLPKDIIMTDWEYARRTYYLRPDEAPEGSYPSIRYLLDHGFSVLPLGCNEPRSLMLFAQSAFKNSRIDWLPPGKGGALAGLATPGADVLGFGGTTWGHFGPDHKALHAHAAVAAFAWNPNQTCAELPDDCRQFMIDSMSWR